jgi:hypothetical protein
MKMPNLKILERIDSLSESQKFYIGVFLTGSMIALTTLYLNFSKLKEYKQEQIKEKIVIISNEINESLDIYKEMLLTISPRIFSLDNLTYSNKMVFLLKQFYLSSSSLEKVNFTDIRWYSTKSKVTVNRYGLLKTAACYLETSMLHYKPCPTRYLWK